MDSEINLQELVREELLDKPVKSTNERAFLAGILRGSGELIFTREGFALAVSLYCGKTMQVFLEIVKRRYEATADVTESVKKIGKRVLTYLRAEFGVKDAGRILSDCRIVSEKYTIEEGLPKELIKKNSDKKEFLIGVFLSCGILYAPQGNIEEGGTKKSKNSGYHLEFPLKSASVLKDFTVLLNEICGYEDGSVAKVRKEGYTVYIKSAERISDCLAAMGANNGVLKLQEIIASRNMRNLMNRGRNFILANIDRTTAASEVQISKIMPLYESGLLKDEKLMELASLRIAHSELTLEQLAELTDPPSTKSAVNHRLRKLIKLADEYEINHKI